MSAEPPSTPPSEPARRRRRALILLAPLALVALIVGLLVAIRSGGGDGQAASTRSAGSTVPSTTGRPSPSPTPTAAPALPRRAGVTFGSALYPLSEAAVGRALDQVVDLHMTWIRIDLSWAEIQPLSASRFDWSSVDTVVDAARERDLTVLGLLTYTPSWARAKGCTTFVCPPSRTAEFADFAAAAVERYGPKRISTYQIWNEPNLDLFWRNPDPESYGRLLDASVRAMRAESDGLRILFGGLAFTGSDATDADGDIGPARFLTGACADSDCRVDAVGFDPYTYPGLPSATSSPLNAWQLMVNAKAGRAGLRTAMSQAGLGRQAIWVTGFGAPTRYPGASSARVVTPAQQSRILLDGLRLAGARRDVIGAYFVDTLRDARVRGSIRDHFGLVSSDGTRKPAFAALARALKR